MHENPQSNNYVNVYMLLIKRKAKCTRVRSKRMTDINPDAFNLVLVTDLSTFKKNVQGCETFIRIMISC